MKKLILLSLTALMAVTFNACKKDKDDNGNPNPGPTSCRLKSVKETITENGKPDKYNGFVLHYDGDKITRASFIDTASGNEDSLNYVLLSYNGNNITDLKFYQDNNLSINMVFDYNSQNLVRRRSFDINTGGVQMDVTQDYVYDSKGQISYCVRTMVGTVPFLGNVSIKDSAVFTGYNSFGRPAAITVFNSTTTDQGTQPYEYSEEIAYEYDANGNRTKESSKEDVADPFTVTRTASYDLNKKPGDAEHAFRVFTRLTGDGWEDPNINTKDVDNNLVISETVTEDGTTTTTTTTYTMNNRNSPTSSTETGGTTTTTSAFSYECK